MALYDQLPADSTVRRSVAIHAFASFVAGQRYADVLDAGNYASMSSTVERLADDKNPRVRAFHVQTSATYVEVLAGAGKTDHAHSRAERLLKYELHQSPGHWPKTSGARGPARVAGAIACSLSHLEAATMYVALNPRPPEPHRISREPE